MFNFVRLSATAAPRGTMARAARPRSSPRWRSRCWMGSRRSTGAACASTDASARRSPPWCRATRRWRRSTGRARSSTSPGASSTSRVSPRPPAGRCSTAAPPAPLKGAPGEMRLMTIRSEGQFNTVVYEEEDIYRGQERRDVILMHPSDRERLGLRLDQRCDGAQRRGLAARMCLCARRTSAPATRQCTTPRRMCWWSAPSIPDQRLPPSRAPPCASTREAQRGGRHSIAEAQRTPRGGWGAVCASLCARCVFARECFGRWPGCVTLHGNGGTRSHFSQRRKARKG